MRDQFYSDKHDLVKWAILYKLANDFGASRIIQIAFYRPSNFSKIIIDNKESPIPQEVIVHFRDLRKVCNINSKIRVDVFDVNFEDRKEYLDAVKSFLSSFPEKRRIVFLDPDTGLAPNHPDLRHVLESDAKDIWDKLKPDDIYIFYQHRNRKGNWIKYMQGRLAGALKLNEVPLKIAHELDPKKPEKTPDVVFLYAQKPPGEDKEEKIKKVPTRRKDSIVEAILREGEEEKIITIDEALERKREQRGGYYFCLNCGKPLTPHKKRIDGGGGPF